ncbi:cation:dicarboxylase symporter family transporter [Oscillatoria amoena NRMC-F 0135]|nr:cation:dicarboxylase symporter family transporter [Oscillatoria amoena NRMC-F 0135]
MNHRSGGSSYHVGLIAFCALVAGFISGWWVNQSGNEAAIELVPLAEGIGKVWLTLLILLAIPLVGAYLYIIASGFTNSRVAGRIGLQALVFHLLIMALGIGFTLSVGYSITAWITDGFTLLLEQNMLPRDEHLNSPAWIQGVDLVQTSLARIILPSLILFAVMALVLSRFAPNHNGKWLSMMHRISLRANRLMNQLLLFMPVAALCLAFALTAIHGYTLAGLMGQYVLALIGMLIVFTVLLYAITAVRGSIPIGRFATALIPAQVVAASTRSSLAALPALLESSEHRGGIPAPVARLVIPLSVSVFRLNRAITSIFSYVFFTALYGIPTDFPSTLLFSGLIILLSFGSPGLPSGGKLATMPVFLALGVPIEMVLLTKAIDVVPDVFKTVLNVTEAMTIASLVTRTNQKELFSRPETALT